MKAVRSARIDTLRGIAVFGILLVNVWGFTYGSGLSRYGMIGEHAALADKLVVFLVAAFAEQKFYPIFAFLFGASFALQTGGRRAAGAQRDDIRMTYLRRVTWLLGCGLLHGTLLWFGDILTVYAVCGFWLATQTGRRLADIAVALRWVVALNVAVTLFMAYITYVLMTLTPDAVAWGVGEGARAHAVYSQGTLIEIAHERLADFWSNLANAAFFVPKVALLFLMGVFSVRLGWLTHPQRHRALWRKVLLAALWVGVPLNLWWGWAALRDAVDPMTGAPLAAFVSMLLEVAGPLQAAGYVAALMCASEPVVATLAQGFAAVGRMALTNYLMQSVLCDLLLQGAGFGLGAVLSHGALVGVSMLIMIGQVLLSRWWMRRHRHGPVETLWRRFTGSSTLWQEQSPQ
ncbi:DUF418 domain-containing protein [Massilia antarctica]|uniref:DUF418 domain-containing protein n=1 Tax=Massilia antarctica TaxID=2765360 RepID=UPI0006BB7E3A|nr:DUF418 domain-containing protein [Massilia sp. H27-R4]MCY0910177.1 DUF418 domain-containing protein [Massilia sp. H27-R4]CUI02730.1 10 TMS hypothetical membrane protein [Janthinobacterium sp. CG23_2]CUU26516.1 10 TMS hypothetical membrane protein [Janthinobacterium sp. CG23_2]